MYCPSCGKQISENSSYCLHCGKQISVSPPVQAVTDWEYKDITLNWPSGVTGWVRADAYPEPAARLYYWQNIQSEMMPVLQELYDQGWQPVTEVGPSCIQLRYYRSLQGLSWFWTGLMVISTSGIGLLFLPFMRSWKYQMVGSYLRLRRPKSETGSSSSSYENVILDYVPSQHTLVERKPSSSPSSPTGTQPSMPSTPLGSQVPPTTEQSSSSHPSKSSWLRVVAIAMMVGLCITAAAILVVYLRVTSGLHPSVRTVPVSTTAIPVTSMPMITSKAPTVAEPSSSPVSTPTNTSIPATATAAAQATATAFACLNAAYVADVTIPDETHFDNSASFVKTWRVRNNGKCDWNSGVAVALESGDKMDAPDSVVIGAAKVGQQVEVSVPMKAPAQAGKYKGVWRMKDASGIFFGGQLTVIIVAGNPTPTPLNKLKNGNYRVKVVAGQMLQSVWTLEISGSNITGKSEWDCCPGHRIDPLNGRIENDHVVIERDCSGQGYGECHQVYIGTLVGDLITGSFTGTGATGNASWTLYLKP
jgi:hypothetical protein